MCTSINIKSLKGLVLLMLISLFSSTYAQEWPTADKGKALKIGKLPSKWLRYNNFEPDSSAAALILADMGESKMMLSENFTFTLITLTRRFKVLKDAGVEAGDIKVYYQTDGGAVSNISGYTYNLLENGSVEKVKLDKKDIYTEEVADGLKMKKWAMPKVKKGSVFEYTYTLRIPGQQIVDWVFQDEYPVLHSRYQLSHPEIMILSFIGRGNLTKMKVDSEFFLERVNLNRGRYMTLRFLKKTYILNNILPLEEEPYTTSMKDYAASIKFILQAYRWPNGDYDAVLPTWAKFSKNLLEDPSFGKAMEASSKYKAWLQDKDLDLSGNKDLEHARKVYRAVQENFEWDERYRPYLIRELSDVLDGGKACSGGINLVLAGLYRHLGFEAHPVILSTRQNGAVYSTYAMLSQFNHAICLLKIGGQYYNLDASDKYCLFGMLPTPSLNEEGYLLMEGNSQWIKLKPNFPQIQSCIATGSITEEGELSIKLTSRFKSSESCDMRRAFNEKDSENEDFAKGVLFGEQGDEMILDELNIDFEDPDKPFEVECKLNTGAYLDAVGEFMYLQPMLGQGFEENPFKLKERTYPVDFARPMQWEYTFNLQTPSGYEVESMPEPVKMVLPNKGATFLFQIMNSGPFVQLKSQIIIQQTRFSPEEYGDIKAFFDQVTAKHGEQIVLKKISK